jgi:hypothetical protein
MNDIIHIINNYMDYNFLNTHLTNIKGLKSKTASPSDAWLLEFDESSPIRTAFAKIFIIPNEKLYETLSSFYKGNAEYIYRNIVAMNAIEYESRVYQQTNELLMGNISPSFVYSYGTIRDIPFNNMVGLLENRTSRELVLETAEQSLIVNTYYMMLNLRGRPEVQTSYMNYSKVEAVIFNEEVIQLIRQLDFGMIILEEMDTDLTVGTYMNYRPNFEELYKITFQVACACYAMYLAGIIHNDIHAGNVFLKRYDTPVILMYIIDENIYTIETYYVAKIFDFDRAFSIRLGDNNMLDGKLCERVSQCNILLEPKDFIKFMCYVSSVLSPEIEMQYIYMMAKNILGEKLITDAYRKYEGCFLQTEYKRGIVESILPEDYVNFEPMPRIIEAIYTRKIYKSIAMEQELQQSVGIENMFVISRGMFDFSRNVKESIVKKTRSHIYQQIHSITEIVEPDEDVPDSDSMTEITGTISNSGKSFCIIS